MGRGILLWLLGVPIPIIIHARAALALTGQEQEHARHSHGRYSRRLCRRQHPLETSTSGVAWPAIIGGAFAAAALSLILLALGSGFGLASVSPWPNAGASVTTFTVMTAVWLIVTQWLASGLGGYLTGRLRTKWVGLHTHEVFFRDTANGFLTWATATVIGAVFPRRGGIICRERDRHHGGRRCVRCGRGRKPRGNPGGNAIGRHSRGPDSVFRRQPLPYRSSKRERCRTGTCARRAPASCSMACGMAMFPRLTRLISHSSFRPAPDCRRPTRRNGSTR